MNCGAWMNTNSPSVNSQMLRSLVTMNCDGRRAWISSLWTLKCCGLWSQWTVIAEGHEFPLCELSNVVAFGHNELWWPKDTNCLSVNSQMLWSLSRTNCGSYDNEGSPCVLLNVELAIMPSKYIDCCIKILFEWTTSPALANTTTMVEHQCSTRPIVSRLN